MGLWSTVASVAGSVIGAFAGDDDDKGSNEQRVLPKTVSGNNVQDIEFLFSEQATEAFNNLTQQMAEWSQVDRNFFEQTFRPFQEELIATNQALLPTIQANTTTSLEQNMKDLLGSEDLKTQMRSNISQFGTEMADIANRFSTELDNLPTEEQRIGQAVTAVEQKFGQAGAEIKRALASQGQNVSQATLRELGIQKAAAKAGAVGAAGEAARAERRAALQQGAGVFANLQQGQSAQLGAQQQLAQTGANLTPQVGGVQAVGEVGQAGVIGADLTKAGADRLLGQSVTSESKDITQPGVVGGTVSDQTAGSGGGAVDGNVYTDAETGIKVNTKGEIFNPEANRFEAPSANLSNSLGLDTTEALSNIGKAAMKGFSTAGVLGGIVGGIYGAGKSVYDNYTKSRDGGEGRSTSGGGAIGGVSGDRNDVSTGAGGRGGMTQ